MGKASPPPAVRVSSRVVETEGSSHLPSSPPLSSAVAPCWPNYTAQPWGKKTLFLGNSSFPPSIFSPGSWELKVGSQPMGHDCKAAKTLWDNFQALPLLAKPPFEQPFSDFNPHPCSLLRQKKKKEPCLLAPVHDLKRTPPL